MIQGSLAYSSRQLSGAAPMCGVPSDKLQLRLQSGREANVQWRPAAQVWDVCFHLLPFIINAGRTSGGIADLRRLVQWGSF